MEVLGRFVCLDCTGSHPGAGAGGGEGVSTGPSRSC